MLVVNVAITFALVGNGRMDARPEGDRAGSSERRAPWESRVGRFH